MKYFIIFTKTLNDTAVVAGVKYVWVISSSEISAIISVDITFNTVLALCMYTIYKNNSSIFIYLINNIKL